ncbi:MAG: hypothetical protein HKL86_09820 [Acidimicrobiaceae bacterium]|nr:hypothetical protein [Acidimicrobiaceae bacterium]
MFGWMRKHGQLELCLVLPDGSKSLIPASWTDVDTGAEVASGAETLGSLAELLHARSVVDGLIHRSLPAGTQDAERPTEEVSHATTPSAVRLGGTGATGLGARGSQRPTRGRGDAGPADDPTRPTRSRRRGAH